MAERLAKVSKHLEEVKGADGKKLYDPETVALFLMRCLFTMFAEDVELLPAGSFQELLGKCIAKPELFPRLVGQLWEAMDTGGFSYALEANVKRFNGYLFKDRRVLPLPREEIGELFEAAKANWKQVEPAIFGTLLEQALDPAERRKLGAHYTPRAYVERLVTATVLEPLKAEWTNVQAAAEAKRNEGDKKGAIALVQAFDAKLCDLRILDPACGTGNFLYVSLELLKRLEGEVLEALAGLQFQEQEALRWLQGHNIDPHQFLGLEVNPRAAAITELVLWIGYLQWHFRTREGAPEEPILSDFKTIKVTDAVLAWSSKELARDEHAKPLSRKDAEGKDVPIWRYKNPKQPEWPEADYIVGNPPFIGAKYLRERLGDEYVEALWMAHRQMNESADFVMYWWDHAAEILTRKGTRLKRFGFVTTNSITQVFQRRVMERHFKAKKPISLLMAVPDHPWTKATRDAAAVRIAMTVVAAGLHQGILLKVTKESDLDSDLPTVETQQVNGDINSDLTIGSDLTRAVSLQSNASICSTGVKLHGTGFIITENEAKLLGLGKRTNLANHIKAYRNGKDIIARPRQAMVIDLLGLHAEEVRTRYPEIYQHLLANVKPERDKNNRESYRQNWWIFGEPRKEFRPALNGICRYIVSAVIAKHRLFQFLDSSIIPDVRLVCFALEDSFFLAVLSSRIHLRWAAATGATLEDRPTYITSRCFDPFPFPDTPESLKIRIRETAEELDALRKQVQAEHPGLTLTQIYNVLEKLRASQPLNAEDEEIKAKGLVLILRELHDRIDHLVAEAYGWPANLSDDEILAKLVALNAERAAEEKRGLIRWLRPEYQIPRAGLPAQQAAAEEQLEAPLVAAAEKLQKPSFPANDLERAATVFAALMEANEPLDARAIARTFKQGAKAEPAITRVLASLARLGHVQSGEGGTFALRRSI
nr:DNA methyltransferase [Methyloferula stellata]